MLREGSQESNPAWTAKPEGSLLSLLPLLITGNVTLSKGSTHSLRTKSFKKKKKKAKNSDYRLGIREGRREEKRKLTLGTISVLPTPYPSTSFGKMKPDNSLPGSKLQGGGGEGYCTFGI